MDLSVKIRSVAEQLFFKCGIREVSMDDVSKNLKISKKTLYKCFSDKSELVKSTIIHHSNEIESVLENIANTESNPIRQLQLSTEFAISQLSKFNKSMLFDLQKYHPQIYTELVDLREKSIIQYICKNIDKGREQGIYRIDFNKQVVGKSFALTIHHFTETIIEQPKEYSPDMLNEVMRYHIRGIANLEGLKMLENLKLESK